MSEIVYVKCPYCGEDIESDSVRCDQCGEELMVCPKCKKLGKDKFCTDCGVQFVKASEAGKQQSSPVASPQSPTPPPAPGSTPAQPLFQPQQVAPQPPVHPQQPAQPQPPQFQQPQQPQWGQQPGAQGWSAPTTDPNKFPQNTGTSLPGSYGAGVPGAPMPGQPSMLSCRMMNISIPLRNGTILGRVYGDFVPQLCVLPSLSGTHARIDLNGGRWTITDIGSSYGTTVNGVPCPPNQPVFLKQGDIICFARSYTFNVI